MTKKVLTIGGAIRDLFLEYDNPRTLTVEGTPYIMFEEGRKFDVKNILICVGGGAANTATSFKQLGFDTHAFFKAGNDPDGQYIKRTLEERGIQTDHAIMSDAVQTGISCIIPTPSGNRTVLVYRGATATLNADEIPFSAIDACDQLYVTSLSDASSLQLLPIVMHAKKRNKLVAVNPGGSQLRARVDILGKSLAAIDIFILNRVEAQQFMDALAPTPFTIPNYVAAILARGPRIVVVTDGAQGVYVAHEHTLYFYPALPIHVVSSVGAGDAFGSTFVGMRAHGASVEDALIAGMLNASSVLASIGAQSGLMTLADIKKQLAHADRSLLQKHAL